MWDFSGLFTQMGDKLAGWGSDIADFAKDEVNKATGGMLDYAQGNLKPTEQTDNPVQNVMAGAKNPGFGQLATDLGAGNWGSALGNIGKMGSMNSPNAQQVQAQQAQQQQAFMDSTQRQIAQNQQSWLQQGQQLQKDKEKGEKNILQLAQIFGI